mgnify:CR=1 FL=1
MGDGGEVIALEATTHLPINNRQERTIALNQRVGRGYIVLVGNPTGRFRREPLIMTTTVLNQYTAHLDTKKRLTIRGALSEFFAVKVFTDGHVVLEPRVLVEPGTISRKTLRMMDQSAANMKKRVTSPVIDLKKYR